MSSIFSDSDADERRLAVSDPEISGASPVKNSDPLPGSGMVDDWSRKRDNGKVHKRAERFSDLPRTMKPKFAVLSASLRNAPFNSQRAIVKAMRTSDRGKAMHRSAIVSAIENALEKGEPLSSNSTLDKATAIAIGNRNVSDMQVDGEGGRGVRLILAGAKRVLREKRAVERIEEADARIEYMTEQGNKSACDEESANLTSVQISKIIEEQQIERLGAEVEFSSAGEDFAVAIHEEGMPDKNYKRLYTTMLAGEPAEKSGLLTLPLSADCFRHGLKESQDYALRALRAECNCMTSLAEVAGMNDRVPRIKELFDALAAERTAVMNELVPPDHKLEFTAFSHRVHPKSLIDFSALRKE